MALGDDAAICEADEAANIALITELHDRQHKRDPGYLDLYDPQVVWRVPGRGGLSGVYEGREGVRALLGRLQAAKPDPFKINHLALAGQGNRVFALHNTRASREGKADLDGLEIIMYTVAGGKIIEVVSFIHDLHANDAFWL